MNITMHNFSNTFNARKPNNDREIFKCFRDEELFDPELDIVTDKYSQYDEDDLEVMGNIGFFQEPFLPARYDFKKTSPEFKKAAMSIEPTFGVIVLDNEYAEDVSFLKNDDGTYRLSARLYNRVVKDLKDDPSPTEINYVLNAAEDAKLTKADGSEYVDFNIYHESLKGAKRGKYYEYIQNIESSIHTDERGNQYFDEKEYYNKINK